MSITTEQRKKIDDFLFNDVAKKQWTKEQQEYSYEQMWRGGKAWNTLNQGGTGILLALAWYHHIYKPNSREWRPSIIIKSLCSYLKI